MKPSWNDAPEWAQWMAMDADGTWCWYQCKPSIDAGWFCSSDGAYERVEEPEKYYDDFIESLEQRP